MRFAHWLPVRFSRPYRKLPKPAHRLTVEVLEERCVLATFTVTSTEDDGSGGTLREAIFAANADPGNQDTINFNIPAAGVQQINLTSILPDLTGPVIIDGTTQPGYTSPTPLIYINGSAVGTLGPGLILLADGNAIQGLAIGGFTDFAAIHVQSDDNTLQLNFLGIVPGTGLANPNKFGIFIDNANDNFIGGSVISFNTSHGIDINGGSGNTIEGNLIGVTPTGLGAAGNGGDGVHVRAGATGTDVGGTSGNPRNIISGNAGNGVAIINSGGTTVAGNYIGVNALGTGAILNGGHGVDVLGGAGNTIGDTAGFGNVISGNQQSGVHLAATTSNDVVGNLIGTNAAGSAALAVNNNSNGVYVEFGAINNTIGGATLGERNIISGNLNFGVILEDPPPLGLADSNNEVLGNLIGLDITGTFAIPNRDGVILRGGADGNAIGAQGASNIISGNTRHGVILSGAFDNTVQANFIGTEANGVTPEGNGGNGVLITGGAAVNTVGVNTATQLFVLGGNVITANGLNGVQNGDASPVFPGDSGGGNHIFSNQIFNNSFLGISDTNTPPAPVPVLTGVTRQLGTVTISGVLNAGLVNANKQFDLQFFTTAAVNPVGVSEGQQLLGSVRITLDASGSRAFSRAFAPPNQVGSFYTVTATEVTGGNTSAFSNAVNADTVGVYVNGQWFLNNNNNAGAPSFSVFSYGFAPALPVVGDWDGDGDATVGVFDPRNATWYLRNSNTAGAPNAGLFQYGGAGWIPVVGDWNGDGTTTVGVVEPSTMTWYLTNTNSSGPPSFTLFQYGAPGWIPVVGDWDGNGTSTIGVFDPQTATWYLRNSNTGGSPDAGQFQYGAPGWRPVTGDWNGDGVTTIGAFNPATAQWFLRDSNTSGAPTVLPVFSYGFGTNPVAGTWGSPQSQLRAAAQGSGAADGLNDAQLHAVAGAALEQLAAAGADPAIVGFLRSVRFAVTDLSGAQLGLFSEGVIVLDVNAAGHGWFVDATPWNNKEYAGELALAGGPAAGRMDLLSAVFHELGHAAGFGHGAGVMEEFLTPGQRHVDALDAFFAR